MATQDDGPLVSFPFSEADARIEDFLDDKLQSAGDLVTIDALLASVGERETQLQQQLEEAAAAVAAAQEGAAAEDEALRAQLDEFSALERAVEERLAAVRASDAPEAAVARLEEPLRQLRRVALAEQYVELLGDVGAWAAEARARLPADPGGALEPYGRLRRLAAAMGDESLHVTAYVSSVADGLWAEMNATMRAELEAVLEQRRWPAGVDAAVRADETWRDVFAKLVDLQAPEIVRGTESSAGGCVALLPVDVMAQIYVREFRYHFLSGRKTSDPRQFADVCLPWLLEHVDAWADFLRDSFADLLAARFAGTAAAPAGPDDLDASTLFVDPACAFIAALLPVVREKVARTVAWALQQQDEPTTASAQQPLCTLIVQLHVFDDELRARFGFDGGRRASAGGWPGLAADVLDAHLDRWLAAEKDLALARYRDAVAAPDGRDLDFDFTAAHRSKPTLAAERVVDLLRSVTDQYRRVRRFAHRLRFLLDIQITLLDDYDDRLRGSLESFAAMTSTVGRTIHGATREQLAALEGTGGFEALCRVYGSAEHVVHTLREWGDDEFFVELHDELQRRSAKGPPTDGSMFDDMIKSFDQRREVAQNLLVGALAESHRKVFLPYVLRTQWTTVAEGAGAATDVVDPAELTITAELDEPLRILKRNLGFVSRALGTAPLRRVVRGALGKLQEMLWEKVLMVHSFSALGAAQLARDVGAVSSLAEQVVPRSAAALEGLREGVRLLNVPAAAAEGAVTLQAASDRVFTDNAEAKKVLQELGLGMLTPTNARLILQRRVESSA